MKLFAVKSRRNLEIFTLQVKKVLGAFSRFCVQKRRYLPWSSNAFWKFSACKFYRKSSGRNFMSCASINEAVCCEVQTHFGSPLPYKIYKKKFWTHFLDFFVQKWSCLPLGSDAFWTFSACKVYSKKFRAECQDICVQKRSGLLWSSDASWKFSPCKVTENVLGAFSWFLRPKTKLSAVKFKRIFDVSALHALYKMFWAHFLDFSVQKRSCLPWNSDAFWTFSACTFYRKGSGHNFTICASKNEPVCCEVQTHFASFPLARLIKRLWAHFHDLCVAQTNILDFNIS